MGVSGQDPAHCPEPPAGGAAAPRMGDRGGAQGGGAKAGMDVVSRLIRAWGRNKGRGYANKSTESQGALGKKRLWVGEQGRILGSHWRGGGPSVGLGLPGKGAKPN